MKLHWQIFIGLIIGALYGYFFPQHAEKIAWLVDIFLRALKMIIVPLIISSIISGVTNIGNAENLGRIGLKTISYYIVTSIFAIITGLFFVNLIQPGVGADIGLQKKIEGIATDQNFAQIITGIVPDNIFKAMANSDMLSIIFFAIIFGIFISKTSEKYATSLTTFFNAVFEVMMKITLFVIKFTPIGVFAIVANTVAKQPNLSEMLMAMGKYMLVVLAGLLVHSFITLPLFLKFIGKINPLKHFRAMRVPLITAFSTSSSNATLPLTLEAVEDNVGVSNKISSFTLPLGSTINMDGTALYECVAAMFIAQAYGIHLDFLHQVIIVITTLLASIGAAGIPMAGTVMLSIVLHAVGLPLEGIGLVLSVDRILDMFRTAVNVLSDSCGAAIIAKSENEVLKI